MMGEEERGRRKKEKKEREEEVEREAYLLSKFFDDRTFGSRWSKKESSSSWQELQVETEIEEFRQTLRGRGSSPTRFIFGLRTI